MNCVKYNCKKERYKGRLCLEHYLLYQDARSSYASINFKPKPKPMALQELLRKFK